MQLGDAGLELLGSLERIEVRTGDLVHLRLGVGDGLVRLGDGVRLLRERRRGGNDEEQGQQAACNHERGAAPAMHVHDSSYPAARPVGAAFHPEPEPGGRPNATQPRHELADPARRRTVAARDDDLKLGLQLGYWPRSPDAATSSTLAQEAERLGFDSVWTAEAWGSDAFSPLVWIGAHTSRIKLGTGIVQISARTPGRDGDARADARPPVGRPRSRLGLGVSGPQVVEGWYGQPFGKPLARTREYIDDRAPGAAARGAGHERGRALPAALRRAGRRGARQAAASSITHPLRADIPIYLGAEGPKNVALAAEIADGWLPLYYSPFRPEVYADALRRRSRRLRDRRERDRDDHRRRRARR